MAAPDLVLRDIHQPSAPPWWPPAPGWWWLAAAILVVCLAIVVWRVLRAWERRRWQRTFDAEVALAGSNTGRIAVMSSLLRRAARRHRADGDRLQGDDWLTFLDVGQRGAPFKSGVGAALRDGAFRRDTGALDLDALHALARGRFVDLMTKRA
ncbi:DUF4381 family protein [Luteimonas terrae]|uniref:DUF4381 domain-containing protein n=1 Tax=Luteimonas terrae TaxID=1530191 RepID=A0A4R5UEZ2_9GAMM|nr:DUF4381 family protein [Luteimonas terrae]TDK33873.1 DUF4381 domain-containing protein [Luteimonas terrae]